MDYLNDEMPEEQAVESIAPDPIVDQVPQEPVPEQPADTIVINEEPETQENPKKESWQKRLFKDAKDVLYMLAIFMLIYILCFRTVVVVGDSMYDTLVNGDRLLLVSNLLYRQPEQGDVIVASKASFRDGECIIKRVIATEGQVVDIDFETGTVYVDGVALVEPYIHSPTHDPEGVIFPITVPDGCLFVMGDNRGESLDSRSPSIGFIDKREILGKAIFLMIPGFDERWNVRDYDRIGVIG